MSAYAAVSHLDGTACVHHAQHGCAPFPVAYMADRVAVDLNKDDADALRWAWDKRCRQIRIVSLAR